MGQIQLFISWKKYDTKYKRNDCTDVNLVRNPGLESVVPYFHYLSHGFRIIPHTNRSYIFSSGKSIYMNETL